MKIKVKCVSYETIELDTYKDYRDVYYNPDVEFDTAIESDLDSFVDSLIKLTDDEKYLEIFERIRSSFECNYKYEMISYFDYFKDRIEDIMSPHKNYIEPLELTKEEELEIENLVIKNIVQTGYDSCTIDW